MGADSMNILQAVGIDTGGALGRLMNDPGFYFKLLRKFQQDTNFDKLRSLVEAGDTHAAGECAHALKGITASLGMTELCDLCAKLQYLYLGTEAGDPAPVFASAEQCYAKIMEALRAVL